MVTNIYMYLGRGSGGKRILLDMEWSAWCGESPVQCPAFPCYLPAFRLCTMWFCYTPQAFVLSGGLSGCAAGAYIPVVMMFSSMAM